MDQDNMNQDNMYNETRDPWGGLKFHHCPYKHWQGCCPIKHCHIKCCPFHYIHGVYRFWE